MNPKWNTRLIHFFALLFPYSFPFAPILYHEQCGHNLSLSLWVMTASPTGEKILGNEWKERPNKSTYAKARTSRPRKWLLFRKPDANRRLAACNFKLGLGLVGLHLCQRWQNIGRNAPLNASSTSNAENLPKLQNKNFWKINLSTGLWTQVLEADFSRVVGFLRNDFFEGGQNLGKVIWPALIRQSPIFESSKELSIAIQFSPDGEQLAFTVTVEAIRFLGIFYRDSVPAYQMIKLLSNRYSISSISPDAKSRLQFIRTTKVGNCAAIPILCWTPRHSPMGACSGRPDVKSYRKRQRTLESSWDASCVLFQTHFSVCFLLTKIIF